MNVKDYKLESARTRELLWQLFRESKTFHCSTIEARWLKEVLLDSIIWLQGFTGLAFCEPELIKVLVRSVRNKYKEQDKCHGALRHYIDCLETVIQTNEKVLKAKT
jgi:hypothetical protein